MLTSSGCYAIGGCSRSARRRRRASAVGFWRVSPADGHLSTVDSEGAALGANHSLYRRQRRTFGLQSVRMVTTAAFGRCLLISGFGVRVPGGAPPAIPPLTWDFPSGRRGGAPTQVIFCPSTVHLTCLHSAGLAASLYVLGVRVG